MMMGLNSTKPSPSRLTAILGSVLIGATALPLCGTPAATAAGEASPTVAGLQIPGVAGQSVGAAAVPPEDAIEGRVDPDTYQVGPGDQFALRYSDLMDPRIVRVNPAGELLLPDAGPIPVAGLTLREAAARVREALRPYIRGKGFTFVLERPRRFRIPVLGEVQRPGVVTLQAPVRASEALTMAGGVTNQGARRGIQVRRGNDTLRVDLARYLNAGDLATNPLVFETDVIYVPAAGPRIAIEGAVPRGGAYDYMAGDRLSVLVAIAGGTLPPASLGGAELARIGPGGATMDVSVLLAAAIASPGGPDDIPLVPGDRLFIPWRAHWDEVQTVAVDGEVANPGTYPTQDGVTRLRDVLERAGGYTVFADTAAVSVQRADAFADRDTAFQRLALESPDLLLASDKQYAVARSKERSAVSAPVGALLARGDPAGNITLMNGDRILVPRRFPMVSVQGAVRAPGYVPHRPGLDVDDYIKAAGGYGGRADKGNTRVTLAATGRQVFRGEAGPIQAGDAIWVPLSTGKNWWGIARDVITVAGLAATVVLAIQGINN
jgi:protein involved in polysaccharide export with SLBB domain